jgi:hypothetical protein
MPRTLIETTVTHKRYRVTDGTGKVIGEDLESIIPSDLNAVDLTRKAQQALQANSTFLGLANPTAAQVTSQVQKLTRENNALIRLMLNLLDDVSDT